MLILIREDFYNKFIEKGYGTRSHLVERYIIDKNGYAKKVYVNPDKG